MFKGIDLAIVTLGLLSIAMGLVACWMTNRVVRERQMRDKENMLRKELEAYARLDPGMAPQESSRSLARCVCATVAEHSTFRQVAMLMRDTEGFLEVVGSAGVDDLMASAIRKRVARFARERRNEPPTAERRRSCAVTLEPAHENDVIGGDHKAREVIILPLWSQAGEMLGALAVWRPAMEAGAVVSTAAQISPLEVLAQKLGRCMDFFQISERLARAEKMAGLGNLAKGLAHELNNPLTAVLGFAELIAETSTDPRVREDSVAIVGEAMRMKGTIDNLFQFSKPSLPADRAVDVASILRGLTERLEPELAQRGMQLALHLNEEGDMCGVRGDEKRLQEVFEHLLDNAVQAVSARKGDGLQSIRVMLKCDSERIRVVVSDSGSGFADAARVFDPFYTTRQPGEGQGLGLAMSYGIVREHGGDISAFNLYPHGASVVVELPLSRTVKESKDRIGIAA